MAQLSGVNVERLQGGLQRLAEGTDNHLAMIVSLPVGAIATAVNNSGKGVVVGSVFDAEELGINASFDANNASNVHYQITEFFRLAPEAKLYLFNSAVEADLLGFINQNKEVKGYAIVSTYAAEPAGQLTALVNTHQAIISGLMAENRFVDFALICLNGLPTFTVDLFTLQAPNISVVIAAEHSDGKVAVGSVLGMIAVRKISENLGSVDIEIKPRSKRGNADYTLTDSVLGKWLGAYLTDGKSIDELDRATLNSLKEKGYIFAASYEGYSGFFFENSYTAIGRDSDFAYIENNRVWNKAARIIRATLIPRVKSKVKRDPATGFIASTTAAYWQTLCEKALDTMVASDDISGHQVYINPEQIVNSNSPVQVKVSIVADGIVHEFEVAIGLTNNI